MPKTAVFDSLFDNTRRLGFCNEASVALAELLMLDGDERILEIDCGSKALALVEIGKLAADAMLIGLTRDFATLVEAKQASGQDSRLLFIQAELYDLPFGDNTFDRVIVNQVLLDIKYISRALKELKRILVPTGRLLAVTLSRTYDYSLHLLHNKAAEAVGDVVRFHDERERVSSFYVETGAAALMAHFPQVILRRLPVSLEFFDPDDFIAYYVNYTIVKRTPEPSYSELIERVRKAVAQYIQLQGVFRLEKDAGAFIAIK